MKENLKELEKKFNTNLDGGLKMNKYLPIEKSMEVMN